MNMKIHRNLMLVCLLLMASISYAQSETIVVGKKADGTDLKAQCYTFPQRVETFSMSDKGDYLCVSFRETTKSGKYLKNKGEIGFYDTKSSQLLWKQPIDFSKSRITCLSEGVLITEIGSKISLLSRETGAKRWEASLFPVYVDDSLGLVLGYNSPTSNKLRAVNLKFGNDLWENKIPHQYGWNEVLDLEQNKRLIVADALHKLDFMTGELLTYPGKPGAHDTKAALLQGLAAVAVGVAGGVATGGAYYYSYVPIANNTITGLTSNILSQDSLYYWADRQHISCMDTAFNVVWQTEFPDVKASCSKLFVQDDKLFMLNYGYGLRDVFSANFALYGDMSRRVMATLRTLVPSVEVYSIDEAFFDLHGIAEPLDDYGRRIGRTIRRNTGIPVSIGIAPTKTLAKIASKLAKRYPKLDGCCYMHRPEDIEKVLATFPLHEVWGIGRRYGKLFDSMRITTARQFVELPEEWIHRRMGITGLRTWRELQGIECIGFEQMPQQKQQITVSRSFPKEIYEREELERIVAEFASMCAEKLRAQRALCGQIHGFIFTNRHRDDQPQRYETAVLTLPEPTDSTLEIVRQARAALRQIYRPGFGYKKAGVTLAQIVPATGVQGTLFAPPDKGKHARLMEALDRVNKVYGRGSIVIAAQGTEPFRMNREHLSPRYTTDWRELLTVKAK